MIKSAGAAAAGGVASAGMGIHLLRAAHERVEDGGRLHATRCHPKRRQLPWLLARTAIFHRKLTNVYNKLANAYHKLITSCNVYHKLTDPFIPQTHKYLKKARQCLRQAH